MGDGLERWDGLMRRLSGIDLDHGDVCTLCSFEAINGHSWLCPSRYFPTPPLPTSGGNEYPEPTPNSTKEEP